MARVVLNIDSEALRRLRLERFESQAGLARRAGIHPVTLNRLEKGQDATAKLETARKLAEALNVDIRRIATVPELTEAAS